MDDTHDRDRRVEATADLSRRDFVALSVAGGLAAATGSASAAALPLTETEVSITTPDGICDAAFIRPSTGTHPGVLIWPDAFGLRPAMRDMARRLAAEGYSVLVPNPFYRVAKAPVFDDPSRFNFQDPAEMARLRPLITRQSPLIAVAVKKPKARWVRPEVLVEVAFPNASADGRLRHPSFKGFRDDIETEEQRGGDA